MNTIEIATIVSAISTFIIAASTGLYTYYSRRNLHEMNEQNNLLKKQNENNYILERKFIVKIILMEINDNKYLLERLLKEIKIDIEKYENQPDKVFLKYFKDNFKNSFYSFYSNNIREKAYQSFLDRNIDFKNDVLFFEISRLYFFIRTIKMSINGFLINSDKFYKRGVKFLLENIIYRINKSFELIDSINKGASKEINFNFNSFIKKF